MKFIHSSNTATYPRVPWTSSAIRIRRFQMNICADPQWCIKLWKQYNAWSKKYFGFHFYQIFLWKCRVCRCDFQQIENVVYVFIIVPTSKINEFSKPPSWRVSELVHLLIEGFFLFKHFSIIVQSPPRQICRRRALSGEQCAHELIVVYMWDTRSTSLFIPTITFNASNC